jgi:dienelactone hydrolase
MRRREFLGLLAGSCALRETPPQPLPREGLGSESERKLRADGADGPAAGEDGPAGEDGVASRDYGRCLPDHLRSLAARAYEARRHALAELTTPAAIRSRQGWARETLWALIGGVPERTPLQIRTVGELVRPGYRVEKIVYESRPGLHVPANLYVPERGSGPFPGVLFQMGHLPDGKAARPYQRCCQGLAKLGYVVLAFDPMGQGERVYYPLSGSSPTRLGSSDEEHDRAGKQMLLVGDTATRMQLWDAVRSLDVLASRPEVDPGRLAGVGHSGGGTLTMALAAVDDRLAAAAVSCGNTEDVACRDFIPPGATDDAEQDLIGSGPLGFDRWDLLHPLAPKPLLVLVSATDASGAYSPNYLVGSREGYGELQRVYAALGETPHLRMVETPLPHALSYPLRLEIYRWLDRWLRGGAGDLRDEPRVDPEPEEALHVVAGGNVVLSLGGKTPCLLARERAAELPAPHPPEDPAALLGILPPPRGLGAAVLARTRSEGCEVTALEVPSAPCVWVPAWLFEPRPPAGPDPLMIVLEAEGRDAGWQEDGPWQSMAQRGRLVCAADVRGIGDLAPEVGRGARGYVLSHAGEESYAWGSLVLGESLLGQRVVDILSLVEGLANHPATAGRPVVLAARGTMTVPALFSAAMESRIETLYLAGGLGSYLSVVEAEDYVCPLANILPGVLGSTDLPQVAAGMAGTRVIVAGAVDGMGRPLPWDEARALYEQAGNVEVRAEAAWDVDALLGL